MLTGLLGCAQDERITSPSQIIGTWVSEPTNGGQICLDFQADGSATAINIPSNIKDDSVKKLEDLDWAHTLDYSGTWVLYPDYGNQLYVTSPGNKAGIPLGLDGQNSAHGQLQLSLDVGRNVDDWSLRLVLNPSTTGCEQRF